MEGTRLLLPHRLSHEHRVVSTLHSILQSDLCREFKVGKRTRGGDPNGEITTKLRLSAAIRFFAGASIYDIMLTHGMGKQTVYNSVYGVVNAVNSCEELSFNADGARFPSHAEQAEIAAGFLAKSAAGFDKIVMALDGMLVWTSQPSRADCEYLKMGERSFHCFRKDKFGMLLLAGCDHRAKFRWADVTHPGFTGDYLAWTTSDVGRELTEGGSKLVAPEHTIAGDNAFCENETMATPIPGRSVSLEEDAYNFYLSQIRITIERAFGILVHRWGILRRPLSMSILKVPALVMCLLRLHNFCIDHDSRHTAGPDLRDEGAIVRAARRMKDKPCAVRLNSRGIPEDLAGSGHHFRDLPNSRRPSNQNDGMTPMRRMMKSVADQRLMRPRIT